MADMGYGTMGTDRLQGIDYPRMREYRLNRTKEMMKKHGIGTMVTWDGWDIRYIAGVYATIPCRWYEGSFVVLPVNGDPYTYAQTSFSAYKMREELPWLKDKIWSPPGSTKMNYTHEGIKNIMDVIEQIVRDHGLQDQPVALDGCTSEFLLGEDLKKRGLTAVDGKQCMFDARMIKNEDEIECCRMACTIADAAFDAIKQAIRPGVKENELMALGMERLYALGCDETQEFVVATGPRTNPLHIDFTDRMVRPGDLVVVDINGASFQGYKSCYYRTFVCGKANDHQKDLHKRCRDMMYAGMSYIKAGALCSDSYKGFPDSPSYWGYDTWAEVSPYMLIHGLGISLHERPWLYKSSDLDSLELRYEEGMVLAVENWVGERGGTDGVRLEENLVVTKDGYDLLTKYPVDELIECPI